LMPIVNRERRIGVDVLRNALRATFAEPRFYNAAVVQGEGHCHTARSS